MIRRAQAADAASIARVHVDSWRSTYKGIVADTFLASLSYGRRERMWHEVLSPPDRPEFIYVAEGQDRKIVGFVSAGLERTGDPLYRAEIYALYLLAEYQGRGTGRALLKAAAGELDKRGMTSLLIWVLKDNPSRGFYEALGGEWVRDQEIEIGDQRLMESAYGWRNLHRFFERK